MRRIILTLCSVLLLAACSEKVVIVDKPVGLSLHIDEVKGTKIILTITSDDPDAYYSYCLWNELAGAPEFLLEYLTEVAETDYEVRKSNGALKIASFADLNCYRGTRTLRATGLTPDWDYTVLVFQLNPTTHEVIGDVLVEKVHTKPVEGAPLDFRFQFQGRTITVVPSDPQRPYFWDFDNQLQMYNNYMWPYGWYYALIDMYEQYGFMEHLLSVGTDVYDASGDHFEEGEICTLIACAYEDGELTSEYTEVDFIFRDEQLQLLAGGEETEEGEEGDDDL